MSLREMRQCEYEPFTFTVLVRKYHEHGLLEGLGTSSTGGAGYTGRYAIHGLCHEYSV